MDDLDKKIQRKIRLAGRVIKNAFEFGAGFYVGVMDGKGTPMDSATKYNLLAAPSVLNGTIAVAACYGTQKLLRWSLEKNENELEKELRKIDSPLRRPFKNLIEKIAYVDLAPEIPKMLVKTMGKTALKTGVGYAAGYGFARLFN